MVSNMKFKYGLDPGKIRFVFRLLKEMEGKSQFKG